MLFTQRMEKGSFYAVGMKIIKINSFKVNCFLIFLLQTKLEEITDNLASDNTLITFSRNQ